ncbi:hypothetical protein N7517_005740 [Penicillium concentricum]|uniref:Phosphoribosyltransferase domain-containing protein n=1 Tax=Penicillium concentricum TaxID=293559 RepID=A0A9W9VAM8_9EURO|nr:uncharacterized protein N7517_005740 [Penicillium concentricum]KAJ5373734.1 hypothetical protein N7517_005740 [Penicillium concentricum]
MSDQKQYATYNDVHNLCKQSARGPLKEFKINLIIAIGGGGYIPARILRSFLKETPDAPNIPIQAIGLSLYERLGTESVEEAPGTEVKRLQWLDINSSMANLIGKNVLIVDEVDDTRTTLKYAVEELTKDVKNAQDQLAPGDDRKNLETKFHVFVLHNKDKAKKGALPEDMTVNDQRYHAAVTTGDVWICYPWEAENIEEHDRKAKLHPIVDTKKTTIEESSTQAVQEKVV